MSYLDLARRAVAQRCERSAKVPPCETTTSDVDAILSLPLDLFAAGREVVELRVSYLDVTLFFVSSHREASLLVGDGIGRGRIWTAGELIDVLSAPGITRNDVVTIATAKLAMAGEIAYVVSGAKSAISAESPSQKLTCAKGAESAKRGEARPRPEVEDVPF